MRATTHDPEVARAVHVVLKAMRAAHLGEFDVDEATAFIRFETGDYADAVASTIVSLIMHIAQSNDVDTDDAFVAMIDWAESIERQLRARMN